MTDFIAGVIAAYLSVAGAMAGRWLLIRLTDGPQGKKWGNR